MKLRNILNKLNITINMAVLAGVVMFGLATNGYATENNVLPSAGINFFLSDNATSVKEISESKTDKTSKDVEEVVQSTILPSPTEKATAKAVATSKINPLAETETEEPVKEEKVIEETVISTTDMTVKEVERKLDAKEEEEGFKSLVIAKVNDYVNVRKEPSEDAEKLGKLYDKSVGEFVEEKDGWYKITSGSVTGYVKAEYCVTGDDAVALAKEVGTRIATVDTTTLKVREEASTDSVTLGLVPLGEVLTVSEELDGWAKVNIEEGDGYVSLDYVKLSTEFVKAESKEEEEARLAKEEKARLEAIQAATRANGGTGKSSKKAATPIVYATGGGSELGNQVANFALQFNGNPYVYGGTSLTNGADCSGFVMSVYANFGVSLPHSANADRNMGYAVDGLANAQPGDLVCYSGHVGIYIGGGQIIHASTTKTGIKISDANYRPPLAVRRIF